MNRDEWHLDRLGKPTADIICPHGRPVEYLNGLDYAYAYDDPRQTALTEADLAEWLAEHKDDLAEYCFGH